jgi:hypothetical protein
LFEGVSAIMAERKAIEEPKNFKRNFKQLQKKLQKTTKRKLQERNFKKKLHKQNILY